MKKKNTLYLLLLFVIFIILARCSSIKQGDKKMLNGEYQAAIISYKKAVETNKLNPTANYKLAEAFRKSNKLAEAFPYYAIAIKNEDLKLKTWTYYIASLKANSQYDEAIKVLENILETSEDPQIQSEIKIELEKIISLKTIPERHYEIKNLKELNTPADEYSPVYNKQRGELFFTSNRDGGKQYKLTGTAYTDIYKAKIKKNSNNIPYNMKVDVSSIEKIDPLINYPNTNEGSVTFSSNGNFMVFAKGNSYNQEYEEVTLFSTRYRNKKWSAPKVLSISNPQIWDSSPALSPDGTTIYFSSNRKGGFGGLDIWVATLNKKGKWTDVRNLGKDINTPGDEIFPFLAEDGSLYFSSDGHSGFGKLDIFVSKRAHNQNNVYNLGASINSDADDFGIFLINPIEGFFTSNRKGGKGGDDIYTIFNNDPSMKTINYTLNGTAFEKNDSTQTILSNVKIKLLDNHDTIISETFSDNDGRFSFKVFEDETYHLIAEKVDYFASRVTYTTEGKSPNLDTIKELETNVVFDTTLFLEKVILQKIIVLEHVYYDLDKWDIRPDAAIELDEVVSFMKDNPEIEIELSSHTDNRGEHNYNITLSENRAKAAVDYIISNGVSSERIVSKGYGETIPKIQNAQTEEEHQKNRRTEIKITKYDASKLKIEDSSSTPDEPALQTPPEEEEKYFKKE